MKLEIGKRYIRRDGEITDPLKDNGHSSYTFYDPKGGLSYSEGGLLFAWAESNLDLAAECTDPYYEPEHEPEHEAGDLMTDAARWRFYAGCPQTALMLGSKLDPCDKSTDWVAESNRLADAMLAARKEQA